jgi:hypothetical protein
MHHPDSMMDDIQPLYAAIAQHQALAGADLPEYEVRCGACVK